MNCPDCQHETHEPGKCAQCFCSDPEPKASSTPVIEIIREPNYVHGVGNANAKLMIVGEAPGKYEDREGIPFVGESGKFLDRVLSESGCSRSEVYITNVVKVRPPNNDLKRLRELGRNVEEFIPVLWNEIREVNPNCILVLGNLALSAVTGKTGILQYRGSILPATDAKFKAVASVHPANFLYPRDEGGLDYSMSYVFRHDVQRAIAESVEREYRPPVHNLTICKSSKHLRDFIQSNFARGKFRVSTDIESTACIPTCIGIAFDKYSAMSVPVLNVQSWYNQHGIGDHDLNEIWRILIELFSDPRVEVIGQNFKFDQEKIQNVLGIKIRRVLADTMLMGATVHPELPGKLEFLCSIYTREPFYKLEGREYNPKKDPIDRLFLYNAKDCVVTYEVFERLEEELKKYDLYDFFYNQVMPLHDIYMEIEEVGIKVDYKRREEVRMKYKAQDIWACARFQNVTGYAVVDASEQKELKKLEKHLEEKSKVLNLNSPGQVKDFITNILHYPARADTKEDTLVALMANNSKPGEAKREALELLLEIRGVKKALSTYIEAETDYDGRMRTNFRICGTETGRSSTNVLKPPVRPTQSGMAFHTVTKHGEIGPEIREYLVPDEDYAIMECDASQAEARIVANLAEDEETLKLFDTTDIHSLTATWIFKIPIEQVNKKTHRFIGKTVRHAGNYGEGKKRFMLDTNKRAKKYGVPVFISEFEAGQIIDGFHRNTPKIRGNYHPSVEKALNDFNRTLINPFGRRRQFLGRWGNDLFKEAYAQIPQSTVRDLVIRALFQLKKLYPHVRIIMENHDALVALVPLNMIKEYAQAMKAAFEIPIDFSRCSLPRNPLVIPAEVQVGYENYRHLEKYEC